ncbi:hypothetical protein ACFQMA_12305 [Halosimplex aquaticum]|uniref:PH domain-containing protein n=1 Tax=Halosimplex aquaticum TaxID=3026162 RepID=A0ABD5Y8B3_9EURY|nr:hypothetical protein [Halosimplex aquaticum]
MSYQQADSDEAYRIWTESITGNILVAEYDDGDYLIYNQSRNPWDGVLLEPPQMQALLKFTLEVEMSGKACLGEDIQNGKLFVRYRDGAYTLNPEDLNITPTLSEQQMDEITSLVKKMQTLMQDYDEYMEPTERHSQL